ncbi:sodium:solute symporter [Flavobacterium sp. CBA20B-1]|uniref:sodium:solute symporter n=1 Tax=unclassified Flavobacterium TaxID=196869 RepID=UPI00222419B5|nr:MULTISPECIES: sodium:solute symporter [unclassified Flavobacterium]WCM42790.1 sodium:solute symporter [Flavobacterium sp. CBA20B-1]
MTPTVILTILVLYFAVLIGISRFVSRKDSSNSAFFSANKNSKWYLVAFGMIGTALSGVTFISVPGEVGAPSGEQFKYFQFVLGNAVGFIITATVLLPLYYRLQLVSIYEYFEKRLGFYSYKTAAAIFLISRTIGSAFRLYLVVIVFQRFVFDAFGIPFAVTGLISLALIYAYTYKSGLKAIIITDTLQTFFLVSSVILTIIFICSSLDLNAIEAFETVKNSSYSKIFFWEDFMGSKFHFAKQFLGGMFVTIAMTGLDQDLMQKNLSCANIKDAQKNMFTFTGIFVLINIFFLGVGALLYIYADANGVQVPADLITGKPRTDLLFPEIAFHHLALVPAVVFLLGLIAATFATTDSALTALTTSFCIDFLGMDKPENVHKPKNVKVRKMVHFVFCLIMFGVIVLFNAINDASVVSMIFRIASYTYGPLLGLFTFGIFFKNRTVHDQWVPLICLAAPFITLLISNYSATFLNGYVFDNELIIVNAGITVLLLLAISKKLTKTIFVKY